MTAQEQKDQRRRAINREAGAAGKRFEERLNRTFDYYRKTGAASIIKTPEPMRPLQNLGKGRFIACFTEKAQADYEGTIKGGRTVIYEAKYTASDRMTYDRVRPHQAAYMNEKSALGARCYVIAGFKSEAVYLFPWSAWTTMKLRFGHKYITEREIQDYRVPQAPGGILEIL